MNEEQTRTRAECLQIANRKEAGAVEDFNRRMDDVLEVLEADKYPANYLPNKKRTAAIRALEALQSFCCEGVAVFYDVYSGKGRGGNEKKPQEEKQKEEKPQNEKRD